MKRKDLFLFVMLFFSLVFQGQKAFSQVLTQTVRGKVIDSESSSPLAGATVFIRDANPPLGGITNENGEFRISGVLVGRQTIVVSMIGYELGLIPEVQVGSGKEIVLTIKLTEAIVELEEVKIHAEGDDNEANNDMAVVSSRSFSLEQSERFAGSGFDPGRMALSFAGVTAKSDLSNEIVVRGNSPKGILWRLEGIEIPNPNHLSGYGEAGGGVNMLSNNVLASSDFFTGAFPAEYGNAMSGVFDLNLKKGNSQKRESTIQIGTVGLEGSTEGPFKKGWGGSYVFNYRFATLALMEKLNYPLLGDIGIGFQDLNLKMHFPTKKAGVFSVFGLGGISKTAQKAVDDPNKWDEYKDRQDFLYGYSLGIAGLNHVCIFNEKSYLKTTLSYSATNYRSRQWTYRNKNLDWRVDWDQKVRDWAYRGIVQYNHKFNARHSLRVGINLNHLNFKFLDDYNIDADHFARRDSGGAFYLQTYAQWKYRITPELTVNSGLHYSHFFLGNQYSIEPRAGMKWQFLPNQSLSFGLGIHSRLEALPTYMRVITLRRNAGSHTNEDMGLAKSLQFVLGYQLNFLKDFSIRAETYYQHLYNIPVSDGTYGIKSTVNGDDALFHWKMVNTGLGRNYGLELTIEKRFSNNYYFLATGSLYQSEYKLDNGDWVSTRYNANFITNATAGKDFIIGKKKNNVFGLNARVIYAGGNRIVPIDLDESIENGKEVRDWLSGYDDRMGNYFRLDFRISYKMNMKNFAWQISADAQNLTNHKNEFKKYYDYETQSIKKKHQIGIMPLLVLRFEF